MPGFCWRWRHAHGPGRPMKPRVISEKPKVLSFNPEGGRGEPITLTLDEFEALKLVDYHGLLQEEAAFKMGVSRGTLWRCLNNARRKVAAMIVEGRPLRIVD